MQRFIMLSFVAGVGLLVLGLKPINISESQGNAGKARTRSAMSSLSGIRTTIADSADALASLRGLVEDERQNRLRLSRYVDAAIDQAQESATSTQGEVASRRMDADKAAASLRTAGDTLSRKISAIDDAMLNERRAFEASVPFIRSASLVKTLTETVAELTAKIEAEIDMNPAVVKAQSEADVAERAVKQARNEPQSGTALANASHAWIEATNMLSKARKTLLESNQSHQQETAELREAQRELTVLKTHFETSLPMLPSVMAARDARDAAEQALRVAQREEDDRRMSLQRSLDALAQVQKDVEVLSAMKRDPDAQLRKIETSLSGIGSDLADAASAASSVDSDLAAGLSAIECLEGDLDRAAAAIARLECELAEAKRNAK